MYLDTVPNELYATSIPALDTSKFGGLANKAKTLYDEQCIALIIKTGKPSLVKKQKDAFKHRIIPLVTFGTDQHHDKPGILQQELLHPEEKAYPDLVSKVKFQWNECVHHRVHTTAN